jgi:hypothetical protein
MLADIHEWRQEPWDWVVYRTTYKSDPAFCKAIDIINSWIKREVYQDPRYSGVKIQIPHLMTSYGLVIAWLLWKIHKHLTARRLRTFVPILNLWVEGQGQRDKWNKYRVYMVIDEEILQLLNEVLLAKEHAEMHSLYYVKEVKEWYIKVVKAFPDPEETEGVEEMKGG